MKFTRNPVGESCILSKERYSYFCDSAACDNHQAEKPTIIITTGFSGFFHGWDQGFFFQVSSNNVQTPAAKELQRIEG